jgi:hypothetical protein
MNEIARSVRESRVFYLLTALCENKTEKECLQKSCITNLSNLQENLAVFKAIVTLATFTANV